MKRQYLYDEEGVCHQVVLGLKNTEREDILTALRLWLPQLNPKSKKDIQALIAKVDKAGSSIPRYNKK